VKPKEASEQLVARKKYGHHFFPALKTHNLSHVNIIMQAVRKFFVGGNFKSNGTLETMRDLAEGVLNRINVDFANKVDVVVSPVAIHLAYVKQILKPEIKVSAQNVSLTPQGAFTGEIAAEQLLDLDIHWTIIGHSERRTRYGDTDQVVAGKIARALSCGLNVIACIGEDLAQRESGITLDVVKTQLDAIKPSVNDWEKVVLAYEPVWAIGTGRTASPQQAQEVHHMIRNWLKQQVSQDVASKTRVIYGGSVTDVNAAELINMPDIDGFLVGGASLKPAFKTIVEACNNAEPRTA
jgi:triosephosphate isomerase